MLREGLSSVRQARIGRPESAHSCSISAVFCLKLHPNTFKIWIVLFHSSNIPIAAACPYTQTHKCKTALQNSTRHKGHESSADDIDTFMHACSSYKAESCLHLHAYTKYYFQCNAIHCTGPQVGHLPTVQLSHAPTRACHFFYFAPPKIQPTPKNQQHTFP